MNCQRLPSSSSSLNMEMTMVLVSLGEILRSLQILSAEGHQEIVKQIPRSNGPRDRVLRRYHRWRRRCCSTASDLAGGRTMRGGGGRARLRFPDTWKLLVGDGASRRWRGHVSLCITISKFPFRVGEEGREHFREIGGPA